MPRTSGPKGPQRNRRRPTRKRKTRSKRAKASQLGHQTQPKRLTAQGVGSSAGGMIGKLLGNEGLGSSLGSIGGSIFKAITGIGDYSDASEMSGFDVEANSVIQPMTASQVPTFSQETGGTRVRHREFFRDMQSGTDATPTIAEYAINPTNPSLFPWLKGIAAQYEQYQILGMVFEFVSTAGTSLTSAAANMGDLSMATQYNVTTPPFLGKVDLLNHFFSTSGATYMDQMHPIECNPAETPSLPRYVDIVPFVFATVDQRLNDWGIITIYASGAQSVYTIGQLWVTYDIAFYKQRMPEVITPLYTAGEIARMEEYCVTHPESEIALLLQLPGARNALVHIPSPPEESLHKKRMDTLKRHLRNYADNAEQKDHLVERPNSQLVESVTAFSAMSAEDAAYARARAVRHQNSPNSLLS